MRDTNLIFNILRLNCHANWLAQLMFWPYRYVIDYGQSIGAVKKCKSRKIKRIRCIFSFPIQNLSNFYSWVPALWQGLSRGHSYDILTVLSLHYTLLVATWVWHS
jgi:hypothetical protein